MSLPATLIDTPVAWKNTPTEHTDVFLAAVGNGAELRPAKASQPAESKYFVPRLTRSYFNSNSDRAPSVFVSRNEVESQDSSGIAFTEPPRLDTASSFIVLRHWEGAVLSVADDSFAARVIDPKHKRSDEEAEFSISDVTEFDRKLVNPGAVFYWTVGYVVSPTGNKMRVSQIRFRRLPVWSADDIARAKKAAHQFEELFSAPADK